MKIWILCLFIVVSWSACLFIVVSWSAKAQQKGAALLIPSVAPSTVAINKSRYLVWTNKESQSVVYTGASRQTLSNRQVISANQTLYTNGVHYGVAAINMAGVESTLAYWPSNRVAEYWLRGYGTNLNQFTNIVKLATFTNNPPGQMYFWGVADITTRWE